MLVVKKSTGTSDELRTSICIFYLVVCTRLCAQYIASKRSGPPGVYWATIFFQYLPEFYLTQYMHKILYDAWFESWTAAFADTLEPEWPPPCLACHHWISCGTLSIPDSNLGRQLSLIRSQLAPPRLSCHSPTNHPSLFYFCVVRSIIIMIWILWLKYNLYFNVLFVVRLQTY